MISRLRPTLSCAATACLPWLLALSLLTAPGVACAGSGGPARLSDGQPHDAPPLVVPTDGPSLAARVREPGAEAVLLNVWATWCLPCVEEMPDVLRIAREFEPHGLRVLLVSGDFPDQREAAALFLGRLGVRFESFIKEGDDMAFIDAVHEEWSGALPATFVYDGDGRLVQFHEGKVSHEQLESWVTNALGHAMPGGTAFNDEDRKETR